ncbi:hypothetical protein MLD38_001849 [Melastoma candidum]|uniref:Uncharacterized protein n=1 Tax=Melastoma candidum TaxID=119954 RepID=A0ACB9SIH5_9MYRT|nr:hypothetical protein MLD38_001849 [Melastoma candidum]
MKKKQILRDATLKRSCGPVGEIEDAGGREALDGAAEGGTQAANGHPQGVPSSGPSLREIVGSEKVDELSTPRIDMPVKSSSPYRKISRRSRVGGPRASKSRVELLDRKDAPAEPTPLIGNSQLQTHAPSRVPPPDKIEASSDFDEYSTPGINRTISVHSTPRNFIQRNMDGGLGVLPDGPGLLSQQLRARNLKRKLEEAGGLVSWLLSMGLVQFVKIFEHKPVNEFQLASLTMQKLKEMGAAAIGPRRKLMHALNTGSYPSPIALKLLQNHI